MDLSLFGSGSWAGYRSNSNSLAIESGNYPSRPHLIRRSRFPSSSVTVSETYATSLPLNLSWYTRRRPIIRNHDGIHLSKPLSITVMNPRHSSC